MPDLVCVDFTDVSVSYCSALSWVVLRSSSYWLVEETLTVSFSSAQVALLLSDSSCKDVYSQALIFYGMTQKLVGEITEQIQDNMYYKIKTQYYCVPHY